MQKNPWKMYGRQAYLQDLMESTKEAFGGQAHLSQVSKEHLLKSHAKLHKGLPQDQKDIYEAKAQVMMARKAEAQ